jgi:hypothetical protein
MSTDITEPAATAAPEGTDVRLSYAGASHLEATPEGAHLELFANRDRAPVRLDGIIRRPLRFREAMATLYAVVGSDFRYVPKDRTAYLAYLRLKRESANLNVMQAQQAYFSWLLRNDPMAFILLDPVISVHPDQVMFEVFSKDEGSYAHLGVDRSAFELDGEPVCGTTNIDFSQALYGGVQQMRSYRRTRLTVGQEIVSVATETAPTVLEKSIRIPDTWLRGFLQVQSAAALPLDSFALAPIDFYNILRYLRMHADKKGQRRGLRVELVPAQNPRIVLEPWEVMIPGTAGPYKGRQTRVLRLYGRRRLMLLRRFLPFVERVDVQVLGSGLPSFWVLRAGDMTITLGLSGFTAANWSQAAAFDLLLPRKTQTGKPLKSVVDFLRGRWFAAAPEIGQSTGLKGAALVEALQLGCQQGQLMYDLARDVYRFRPVVETPLDLARLQYRNRTERVAHDLLTRRGAVKIVTENRIPGTGLELVGKVSVDEDKRDYRPQMLLTDDGQVGKAECTCPFFRRQGLKAGPCVHLVALRLAYAQQEAQRAASGEDPRATVTTETRAFGKRDAKGEEVVQVTLDREKVKVRWGRAGQPLRKQEFRFNSADEARAEYFARVDRLGKAGYLDATAS